MNEPKAYVIVAAVDYSETGDLALERAFELATEQSNAEVHIIHVLTTYSALAPSELALTPVGIDPHLVAEASEQLRQYADRKLQAYKARVSTKAHRSLFQRAVSHLRLDAPAHEIAELAADVDADLVVVGTHGRRGVSRLLLGSVAEAVVRMAPCPVLVVRPKAEREAQEPKIEPPCARCVEIREATRGQEFWCAQHQERHGRRHTVHSTDRMGTETNLPLVFRQR